VVDLDSFIGEVRGYGKQGAGYGYTRTYGYQSIIATRAATGEVLHIRNRKGRANTQRGAERFVEELLARVHRAGHRGLIVLRADSGFENHRLMRALDQRGVEFSIGVKQSKQVRTLIDHIPETEWVTIEDYPETGQAQIAQTTLAGWRLIVRRARLVSDQAELWPDWRYHTFATNRTVPMLTADIHPSRPRERRAHHPRPQRPGPDPGRTTTTTRQPAAPTRHPHRTHKPPKTFPRERPQPHNEISITRQTTSHTPTRPHLAKSRSHQESEGMTSWLILRSV